MWTDGLAVAQYSPERLKVAKRFFEIVAEEKHVVGGLGMTGSGGWAIKRNNFRNMKDPGNRSKNTGAYNLLDADYAESV